MYKNRQDAGEILIKEIKKLSMQNPLVLAIPRGGVIVAKEIAEKLKTPLDLVISRKIGLPTNPELAIGAVTQDGTILLNQLLIERFNISNQEVLDDAELIFKEIKRRLETYRGSSEIPQIEGRSIILVDDGIATGFTVQAAITFIKNYKPREIILAVPVAARETIERFKNELDKVICPLAPEDFYAVGQFFQDFDQVSDEEVINIMDSFREKGLLQNNF